MYISNFIIAGKHHPELVAILELFQLQLPIVIRLFPHVNYNVRLVFLIRISKDHYFLIRRHRIKIKNNAVVPLITHTDNQMVTWERRRYRDNLVKFRNFL